MSDVPQTERELLIESLRVVDRMSGLLNDLSAEAMRKFGDKAVAEGLHKLLIRRFQDCSGVYLFIAADNIGIDLPQDLRGEDPEPTP